MDKVFLNDSIIESSDARVSAADTGLLYGAGLFETMRACNGVVFSLADHLDRLFFSAELLSINITYDKKYISDAIYALLQANNLTDARIRLTVTSGSFNQDQQPKSTLLVTATNFVPYPAEYYKNGVLVTLSPFRQTCFEPTCGHKTLNCYSRILALQKARENRAAEALWFTVENKLAEGSISNVFLVKNSVLFTPPIDTPVLPGIARKTVCSLALKNGIELVQKDLYINDCLEADEIFLTNVIMLVLPVTRVEKHVTGEGAAGPLTAKMMQWFQETVKEQCAK